MGEEFGLVGVKVIDICFFDVDFGYVVDVSKDVGIIVIGVLI